MVDPKAPVEFDSASLDQVRGVLFSLANRGDPFFESVSTLAVKHALARRGRDIPPGPHLEELQTVRDIQKLRHGRWLPCDTGLVPVGDIFVALSGMPTQILASELGRSVFGDGSCRLIQAQSADYGVHSFAVWWCRAPESTREWTMNVARKATFRLDVNSRFAYFNHWDRSVSRRWSFGIPPSIPPSTIALAREKGAIGTLYFLCRIVKATFEGAEELSGNWSDAFRLGFGLRALADNSAYYLVRNSDAKNIEIRTPRFLPLQELMVMRALGIVQDLPNTSLKSTTIPAAAWSRVELMLRGLGLVRQDWKL